MNATAVKASALFLALVVNVPFAITPANSQIADLVVRSVLRVCADPANIPFSNKKRQGFENKLAQLFGQKLGIPVIYSWFPQMTGFIRNTLRARKCDVVIGYSQGHELVQNTNHYYRSSYVLIYRKNSDLAGVETLSDERLKNKKIGVIAGTPPASVLATNGLMGNAKPFQLMVDTRFFSPSEQMANEVASGELDAGLLWGPIGGYFAKKSKVPLAVVPLVKEKNGPRMVYRITMGIRRDERDWKRQLNRLISDNQDEINALLLDYGVPLLDEQDKLIAASRQSK